MPSETLFQRQFELAIALLQNSDHSVTISYLREKVAPLTRSKSMLPSVGVALRHDRRVCWFRRKGIDKYLWKGEQDEDVVRKKAKAIGDEIFRRKSKDLW